MQSALDPAGAQAFSISRLWWMYFWITAAVYVLVLIFMLLAIGRRGREPTQTLPAPPDVAPPPRQARRTNGVVGGLVGLTAIILFVLLIGDFLVGRTVNAELDPHPIVVQVIGHQWWWEFVYQDQQPSRIVTTANDLHLPVDRPVRVELDSHDVIHSFWVPNLNGKKDLIPGHPTTTWLQPTVEGHYWAQCAEYCGAQHAHMRFLVTVESQEKFDAWLDAARKPAPQPTTDRERRGQKVFMSRQCVMCHTIDGTPAGSRVGPPLTHIASRPTLAAGVLPNTRGDLGGWIIDPQLVKPGVRMPQNAFTGDDLNDLLDYLESLK
jgi:cytochrome c oxidase subunit 2